MYDKGSNLSILCHFSSEGCNMLDNVSIVFPPLLIPNPGLAANIWNSRITPGGGEGGLLSRRIFYLVEIHIRLRGSDRSPVVT